MPFCSECGKEYPDTRKFCPFCGTPNDLISKDNSPDQGGVAGGGNVVKIMDFGISETVRTSMSRVANSSSSGTLLYMAPEQVRGSDVGAEADIYAFGAMLYELLSGHPPFYKGDIHYQLFNEKPAELEGVSPELNRIIQKCLAKDYRQRYRSFEAVEAELTGKKLPCEEKPAGTQELLDRSNMVLVEGGTFRMGSDNGDSEETPVHSVTVSTFYISRFEVTQGLYKTVTGNNPSHSSRGIGNNYPVNEVSWYDAVKFCNKLSAMDGLQSVYRISVNNVSMDINKNGYRLPTEAEWEYAVRGGASSRGYKYSGSNSIGDVAWYGGGTAEEKPTL